MAHLLSGWESAPVVEGHSVILVTIDGAWTARRRILRRCSQPRNELSPENCQLRATMSTAPGRGAECLQPQQRRDPRYPPARRRPRTRRPVHEQECCALRRRASTSLLDEVRLLIRKGINGTGPLRRPLLFAARPAARSLAGVHETETERVLRLLVITPGVTGITARLGGTCDVFLRCCLCPALPIPSFTPWQSAD